MSQNENIRIYVIFIVGYVEIEEFCVILQHRYVSSIIKK